MTVAALVLLIFLAGSQVAEEPVYEPDRIREGCGYLTGSKVLIPIEVGLFYDSEPPFADQYGQAIRIGRGWVHPDQAPYPTGASRDWYVNNGVITVGGQDYVKYGLPRVLGLNEVEWIDEYDGLAVAAEPGVSERDVVYVLTEPADCGFQPYQLER